MLRQRSAPSTFSGVTNIQRPYLRNKGRPAAARPSTSGWRRARSERAGDDDSGEAEGDSAGLRPVSRGREDQSLGTGKRNFSIAIIRTIAG